MAHEQICTWLGLPPDSWPPTHYRLLGLEPDQTTAERVEAEVHRRLEIVRRYQLSHPDAATEAMNRLAQAFVCLTDPESRKVYDAQLAGAPVAELVQELEPPADVVEEEAADPLAWLLPSDKGPEKPRTTKRPRRTRSDAVPVAPPTRPPAPEALPTATLAEAATAETLEEEILPLDLPEVEAIVERPRGRRGLYWQLAHTRRLFRAWEAAGAFLEQPARRVSRPAEATELIAQLTAIRASLPDFPELFSSNGQPGFLVAALSRQPAIVPTFQTLLPNQREALANDWEAGRTVLAAQLHNLRARQQQRRPRRPGRRVARMVQSFVLERPGLILLAAGVLALAIAFLRDFVLRD